MGTGAPVGLPAGRGAYFVAALFRFVPTSRAWIGHQRRAFSASIVVRYMHLRHEESSASAASRRRDAAILFGLTLS